MDNIKYIYNEINKYPLLKPIFILITNLILAYTVFVAALSILIYSSITDSDIYRILTNLIVCILTSIPFIGIILIFIMMKNK